MLQKDFDSPFMFMILKNLKNNKNKYNNPYSKLSNKKMMMIRSFIMDQKRKIIS